MRDMTARQFAAALERGGFKGSMLGFTHPDAPGHYFGGILALRKNGWELHRRDTIQDLHKRLDRAKRECAARAARKAVA